MAEARSPFYDEQFLIERTWHLLQKAENFCYDPYGMSKVKYLYRNKSAEYFDEVKQKGNIMEPRLKDNGGDPMSPINGRLKGVFFCATLYNEMMPLISPYGDTRICIPIEALFKKSSNLYFADFYCFGKSIHYIVLVLTKQGSEGDRFCQNKLPLLLPDDNVFLQRDINDPNNFKVTAMNNVWIEVLYTEAIPINDIEKVRIKKTKEVIGLGFHGGISKYSHCQTCNLSQEKHLILIKECRKRKQDEESKRSQQEKLEKQAEKDPDRMQKEIELIKEHFAGALSCYPGSDKKYLMSLLDRANFFHIQEYDKVSYLYRNQTAKYFQEVQMNGNIMYPRLKDDVGDPRSPINKQLAGVFFCVTLFNENLPDISPYGDVRICIPIQALFTETSNLYFADFYCLGENHYVVLVLTDSGSLCDKFSKRHLPKLDPYANHFLVKKRDNVFTSAQLGLWVEVFYTGSVYTNIPGVFYIKGFGEGWRTCKTRKDEHCEICNLSPEELSRLENEEQGQMQEVDREMDRVADIFGNGIWHLGS